MKSLKSMLVAELVRLKEILLTIQERINQAPEGKLRLSKSHGITQYYHCAEKNKAETYIKKENEELIQNLAQKSYDKKVFRLVQRRVAQIEKIVKDYEDDEIENIFYGEHLERQKFIRPVEPTWEQRLKAWKSQEYRGKEFQEGFPVIMTERGERVRSKSEKILADYFFQHGIEYKYECPIYLNGMGVVYPDFTFLSKKTKEEVYWEHNGKMDEPAYARNAVRKIKVYEKNGIFPGERLILTYETENSILSTREIEMFVAKYLL